MVSGGLKSGIQFRPGDHVLVRCNQNNWLRGVIRRHAEGGVRVWIIVSQTLVCIPSELVSTHLVRWQEHGGNDDFPVPLRCVRPSHLSHRNLYERVEIVSYKKYLEESVEDKKDFLGPNEKENTNSLLPKRPRSAVPCLSSEETEGPKFLRENNPLCCGILHGSRQGPPTSEKKINDDSEFSEKALFAPYGSDGSQEEEYITAYEIVKDPKDEKSMNEARAELFKRFMASRAMLDQTSAQGSHNLVSTDAQNLSKLNGTKVCLGSKHDASQSAMTGLIQNLASNLADRSQISDSWAKKDSSVDDNCHPSNSGRRSGLISMVESGSKGDFETIFASPDNWGKHTQKPPSTRVVPITHDCS